MQFELYVKLSWNAEPEMPQYTQIHVIHIEEVKHEKLVLNEVIQRKDLPRWEIIFTALLVHNNYRMQIKFWRMKDTS